MFYLVDRTTATGPGVFSQCGEPALLLDDGAGDIDDPEFVDVFTFGDAIAEQPQLVTELGRITAVRFAAVGLFGLHQYNSVAAEVLQYFEQPVVEAANFHDGPEAAIVFSISSCQSLEKFEQFIWVGAYLSAEYDITI